MAPGSHDGYVVLLAMVSTRWRCWLNTTPGAQRVEVQILRETVSKLLYST